MNTTDRILSVIKERKEISIPELQMLLSLPYKEVREGLNALVKAKFITFEGGMNFRLVNSAKKQTFTQPLPLVDPKLRRIAEEVEMEPLVQFVVEYYADHPDERILCSRIQLRCRIGFGQAHKLMAHCIELGIFTHDGKYRLTKQETLAVLGRSEDSAAADSQETEREKSLMTPKEFRERLQKQDGEKPSDASEDGTYSYTRFREDIERWKASGWKTDDADEDASKNEDPAIEIWEGDDDDDDDDEHFDLERFFDDDDDEEDEEENDDADDEDDDYDFDDDDDDCDDEDDDESDDSDATQEDMSFEERRARIKEARDRLMKRLEEIRAMRDDVPEDPSKKKKPKP